MKARAAALAVTLLLVPSCTVCLHPERNIWLVDESYEGKTAYVKTGDWVRVVLPVEPKGGRVWDVTLEGGAIEEDGEPWRDEAGPGAGGTGSTTIPFRARRPGISDLTFRQVPRNDPGATPAKTLHVTVFVQ